MPDERSPPKSPWKGLALATVGGLAWALSHGIEARAWLACVALVPLLVVLDGRRPFLVGWLFGTVAWLTSMPWIASTVTIYGHQPGWLGGLALLLAAAYLGLYHALFAGLGARLWRRGGALALAALPALWVAVEVLRERLLSGFPWNLAAYAWTEVPGALALSSWIGAFGVSALVVLVNVALARAIARGARESVAWTLLAVALVLAVGARFATPPPVRGVIRDVRLVQPNSPIEPFFDAAANEAEFRKLLERSEAACVPGSLLVWPESAAWPRDWAGDVRLRLEVQELVRHGGCSVILNSPTGEGGKTFNSVLLVSRSPGSAAARIDGLAGTEGLATERADKRHLVPFGEYVPLQRFLPFLKTIARMAGGFSPAESVRLLDWGEERIGPAVCYEVVFPGETAELVNRGATFLLTVTNDGWYGDSSAPRQHFRAARWRAAENRRWLVRGAITGISAAVRPDGSLDGVLDVGEEGTIAARVVGRSDRTVYTRAPWLVPMLSIALALVGLLVSRRRSIAKSGAESGS